MKLKPLSLDLSPFLSLGLAKPPVGVKFSFFRPDGVPLLAADKHLSLCEMVKEAQECGEAFCFAREQRETCVGKILLGMEEMAPFAESGQIGERLGIFKEARDNQHFYQFVPRMEKGIVNYVLFAPLEEIAFDPDVLVLSATPSQAEVVMRAVTYATGEPYASMTTPVMGCAWFLIHPYKSGKVNYVVPELIHGPKGRQLWPAETLLISIPYRWLPTVVQSLREMELHLPSHEGKEAYYAEFQQILEDLAGEAVNP